MTETVYERVSRLIDTHDGLTRSDLVAMMPEVTEGTIKVALHRLKVRGFVAVRYERRPGPSGRNITQAIYHNEDGWRPAVQWRHPYAHS